MSSCGIFLDSYYRANPLRGACPLLICCVAHICCVTFIMLYDMQMIVRVTLFRGIVRIKFMANFSRILIMHPRPPGRYILYT